MAVRVQPFETEHLPGAAALLAERHNRMRCNAPFLDPAFESTRQTLPIVTDVMNKSLPGLVAVEGDRVVGFLFWDYELGNDSHFAPFLAPRSAVNGLTGSTFDPLVPGVARRLYATASEAWVADGVSGHYLHAAIVDRAITDELSEIGFAPHVTMAVREIDDLPKLSIANGFDCRQLETREVGLAQDLIAEFWHSLPQSPVHLPFIPAGMPSLHNYVEESLADPDCAYWILTREGEPVALQHFVMPSSPFWHEDPLVTSPESIYLFIAVTRPAARGTGANTDLLAHTLSRAHDLGFRHCSLHYLSASFASEYWQRQGFRPFKHWMMRRIDPRSVRQDPDS